MGTEAENYSPVTRAEKFANFARASERFFPAPNQATKNAKTVLDRNTLKAIASRLSCACQAQEEFPLLRRNTGPWTSSSSRWGRRRGAGYRRCSASASPPGRILRRGL